MLTYNLVVAHDVLRARRLLRHTELLTPFLRRELAAGRPDTQSDSAGQPQARLDGRVPHPGVRKSGNRCRYCPRRRSCTSRDTAVRPLRAGPAQNASCCSAAAFSANPMSNRQRAEEQQVHKCSIVRKRLLADDGLGEQLLQLQYPRITDDAACSAVLILAQLMSAALGLSYHSMIT